MRCLTLSRKWRPLLQCCKVSMRGLRMIPANRIISHIAFTQVGQFNNSCLSSSPRSKSWLIYTFVTQLPLGHPPFSHSLYVLRRHPPNLGSRITVSVWSREQRRFRESIERAGGAAREQRGATWIPQRLLPNKVLEFLENDLHERWESMNTKHLFLFLTLGAVTRYLALFMTPLPTSATVSFEVNLPPPCASQSSLKWRPHSAGLWVGWKWKKMREILPGCRTSPLVDWRVW